MPRSNEWEIEISPRRGGFAGFCPAYFDNSYPFYGNKNQASAMTDADITDPNFLTQGPGVVALTGGTQTGELGSTLITAILKQATASNVSYACGADKVFKLTATAVTNGNFPKTIASGTANVVTDLVYYQSKVFIFWNDTGVDGDIALLTNDTTFDDNWGSTVATDAAQLEDAPHYGIVGGDDVMYVTNGRYVATVDTTTLNTQGIDFHTDAETVSVSWNNNRIIIAVNRPNVSGSNFNQSAIYKWNGISPSWEGDPIEVNGEIGAIYTKNGTTFVWWKDGISTGSYSLGFINGTVLQTIKRYSGSLPNQAQVGEWKGFLGWLTSNKLALWGSKDIDTPANLSQYISPKDATAGAFAAPFGSILLSSTDGASAFTLAKPSGYAVTARYKTIAFDVSGADRKSQIDLIRVNTKQMATGAKCDITMTYDDAKSTKSLTQIAYAASLPTSHKILQNGPQVEDFRLDFSWANGSVTNPVKIVSIKVNGHFITNS